MERAFLSVPASFLSFDPETSRNPGKIDPTEVRRFMACVPELYRLQLDGYGPDDFRRLGNFPGSDVDRLLGTTYEKLFSEVGQPLRGEFIDGKGLMVTAGQHRALEAMRVGVPFLPIHVTFPDQEHLARIREACNSEVNRLAPEMASIPALDQILDERFYPDRQRSTFGDRHAGPEALEPVRERGWRNPEPNRDLWWRDRSDRSER